MRWDCYKDGCFNLKQRPKFAVFDDVFPRKINFSDVDGIVEINGLALMLEWKSTQRGIPTGQRIMFERITRGGNISVIVVAGDAERMSVNSFGKFFNGKWSGWKDASMQDVKTAMAKWAKWASVKPL